MSNLTGHNTNNGIISRNTISGDHLDTFDNDESSGVDLKPSFRVDLIPLAKQHIEFLRSLHSHGITLCRPSLESLRRYTDLWLPLVHKHQQRQQNSDDHPGHEEEPMKLIPPADIAWLWHCHRLAPFRYAAYCTKRFGPSSQTRTSTSFEPVQHILLEANPPFTAHFADNDEICFFDETKTVVDESSSSTSSTVSSTAKFSSASSLESIVSQTLNAWTEMYPNESFHLVDKKKKPNTLAAADSALLLLDGFDLLASTDRQATFLWQVSGPHFDSLQFLKDGEENYRKFLNLKRAYATSDPTMIVVPTYQIDLYWHTHMLSSLHGYYADCMKMIGSHLHHDDSLNDRTEGGRLDTAFNATKAAWLRLYGEEYKVDGGMYRGEPPKSFYSPLFVYEHHHQCYQQSPIDAYGNSTHPKEESNPKDNHQPFSKLIGIHGASSTNPDLVVPSQLGAGAYQMEVVWCWKETRSQMKKHDKSVVVGDPGQCWIRYSALDNVTLETAFQEHGGQSKVTIGGGSYKVDFGSMKQTKIATGYKRDICRCVKTTGPDGTTTTDFTAVAQSSLPSGNSSGLPTSSLPHATIAPTWTSLDGTTPDGEKGFLPPNPKSTQRGVNANPRQDKYVFGQGGKGLGYYHITTKDSYTILEKRIASKIDTTESDIAAHEACDRCMSCGMSNPSNKSLYVLQKEKQLKQLKECHDVIRARATADVPLGVAGLPSSVASSNKNNRTTYQTNTTVRNDTYAANGWYDTGGVWLIPPFVFDSGGGCGATGFSSGGGCGGGAAGCGGGGCGGGGGGCGGGGCGGGGCGGGGCGGGG